MSIDALDARSARALGQFAAAAFVVVVVGVCVLWANRKQPARRRLQTRIVFWTVVAGCLFYGLTYFAVRDEWAETEVIVWTGIGFWSSLAVGCLLQHWFVTQSE